MDTMDKAEMDLESKIDFTEDNSHSHEWEIDKDGHGKSKDGDHEHEVISFFAMPCTEDGHVHKLTLPSATDKEQWFHE